MHYQFNLAISLKRNHLTLLPRYLHKYLHKYLPNPSHPSENTFSEGHTFWRKDKLKVTGSPAVPAKPITGMQGRYCLTSTWKDQQDEEALGKEKPRPSQAAQNNLSRKILDREIQGPQGATRPHKDTGNTQQGFPTQKCEKSRHERNHKVSIKLLKAKPRGGKEWLRNDPARDKNPGQGVQHFTRKCILGTESTWTFQVQSQPNTAKTRGTRKQQGGKKDIF